MPESVLDWLVDAAHRPIDEPDASFAATEAGIRDLLSVAVPGRDQPAVGVAKQVGERLRGTGGARVWGEAWTADEITAAFVNGTSAQALDYDDVNPVSVAHLSSVIVPAVAAVGARSGPLDRRQGVALAYCVSERLGYLIGRPAYEAGLQPTHTVGTLAATAGLARATATTPEVTRAAISLVASQLIGLRAHTGTMYKAMQSGVAAGAAVRSLILAESGMRAGDAALDHVLGMLGVSTDASLLEVDKPFVPTHLGVKFIPACGAAHTPVEAALIVRDRLTDSQRRTARLVVQGPPRIFTAMRFGVPANPDEARFSMAYCVAVAWVKGAVVPGDFSVEALADPEVTSMVGRIEMVDDLTMARDGDEAVVTATWDGGTESARIDDRLGYPNRVPTESQRRDKFSECLAPVLGPSAADDLYRRARGPEILDVLEDALCR
jgi:2-methylcitrate dehydratase PrpD